MSLGNPIQRTDNVASKMIRVIATENQTIFTVIGGYRINQIAVFRNGVRLSNNSDFTALDGVTVTLNDAASLNDEVLFEVLDDFKVADAIVSAASTQTIFGDIVIDGDFYYTGSSTGIVTTGADGSSLTGIVTSITAGDNISVNASTGSVTITGLANTANVVADTLVVSGLSTFGGATFSGNVTIGGTLAYEDVTNVDSVGLVTAGGGIRIGTGGTVGPVGSGVVTYFGDGSQLTGIDATSLKDSGATVRVQANTSGAVVTGVLTATSFSGDGSGLTFPPKVIAFNPAALSTGAAVDTNITVTFDQNIQFAGIGTIELRSTTNSGTLIEDFDITNGSVGAALTTSGTQLIINPTSNLSDDTVVYVILPSEGIQATSGGAYYAGSNNYNFRTVQSSFNAQGGDEVFYVNDSNSPTGVYKYHVFSGPGILTTTSPSNNATHLQMMMIGGGGAGGTTGPNGDYWHGAGGGGAGGCLTFTESNWNLDAGTYTFTRGAGGTATSGSQVPTANLPNHEGGDSTLIGGSYTLTAYGGGFGGSNLMLLDSTIYSPNDYGWGKAGGSGGGGGGTVSSLPYATGGTGVAGQGNPGGQYQSSNTDLQGNSTPISPKTHTQNGGGGGGAGAAGGTAEFSYAPPQQTAAPADGAPRYSGRHGKGGDGVQNPAFNSTILAPRVTTIPTDTFSHLGPTGDYWAGGGAGGGGPHSASNIGGYGGGGKTASQWEEGNTAYGQPVVPNPSLPRNGGVNTGGGGGGGNSNANAEHGGSGGPGVMMLRYAHPGID